MELFWAMYIIFNIMFLMGAIIYVICELQDIYRLKVWHLIIACLFPIVSIPMMVIAYLVYILKPMEFLTKPIFKHRRR